MNVQQKLKEIGSLGVYCLPCRDCDLVYLGQTGRDLNTRLIEHKRSIRYAQESSAVFHHVKNFNHTFEWDKASLVFKSNCSYRRKIVESALIEECPNINISKGQWSPDIISRVAVSKLVRRLQPSPPPASTSPSQPPSPSPT